MAQQEKFSMARGSRSMPNIPVKHAPIRKVLIVTAPLEAKLRAYIAYYTAQQGLDPKHAPGESDTIVAIVENFLGNDREFNRHLRNEAQRKPGVAATKVPNARAGDSTTT